MKKRIWRLILACVMVLGLMNTALAADFTDGDEIINTEAVNVLAAIGVVEGHTDGSYAPTTIVKRGEMAKLIATLINGGNSDIELNMGSIFGDCSGHWARNYIQFCANLGIVVGYGDDTFRPDNGVTAVEGAKMLLVALGYQPELQGYGGSQWKGPVIRDAARIGLFEGLDGKIGIDDALSRDNAAQMIYNSLDAKAVRVVQDGVFVTPAQSVTVKAAYIDKEPIMSAPVIDQPVIEWDAVQPPGGNYNIVSQEFGVLLDNLGIQKGISSPADRQALVADHSTFIFGEPVAGGGMRVTAVLRELCLAASFTEFSGGSRVIFNWYDENRNGVLDAEDVVVSVQWPEENSPYNLWGPDFKYARLNDDGSVALKGITGITVEDGLNAEVMMMHSLRGQDLQVGDHVELNAGDYSLESLILAAQDGISPDDAATVVRLANITGTDNSGIDLITVQPGSLAKVVQLSEESMTLQILQTVPEDAPLDLTIYGETRTYQRQELVNTERPYDWFYIVDLAQGDFVRLVEPAYTFSGYPEFSRSDVGAFEGKLDEIRYMDADGSWKLNIDGTEYEVVADSLNVPALVAGATYRFWQFANTLFAAEEVSGCTCAVYCSPAVDAACPVCSHDAGEHAGDYCKGERCDCESYCIDAETLEMTGDCLACQTQGERACHGRPACSCVGHCDYVGLEEECLLCGTYGTAGCDAEVPVCICDYACDLEADVECLVCSKEGAVLAEVCQGCNCEEFCEDTPNAVCPRCSAQDAVMNEVCKGLATVTLE